MADGLLLIEDERLLAAELSRHFEREGWDVTRAEDLATARRALLGDGLDPLVVVSDMSLPDGSALDLLAELRERGAGAEWIFLTGYGSVPDSVRALRLGALDFLEKPCDQERLDLVVNGARRAARARRRLSDQASAGSRRHHVGSFLGQSEAAHAVRDMLRRLTEVPFSALVVSGETGTGKGLAARILHHAGPRAGEPMVEVNCAALPKELLESELFGHEAGAFTGARTRRRGLFEQADGGTLFLDEVSEMDVELQAKLLNAIEDRAVRRLGGERPLRVDVQLVAATNRDLASRVADGTFRSDLFHRLSAFQLVLPPLRERIEDLDDLVPALVDEFNAAAGKRVRTIPDAVWEALRRHRWPGNIRELRNVVERCVLFAEDETFPARWLQLDAASGAGGGPRVEGRSLVLPLDGSLPLEDMDRLIIEAALDRTRYNVTAAARLLGTTRETLRYRIRKYGLTRPARTRVG